MIRTILKLLKCGNERIGREEQTYSNSARQMEKYLKPEVVSLKDHSTFNEKWVQQKISDDPSLLGLGELVLKDSERLQQSGGRLDLLLTDPESNRRYEVELQLGKTDESHVIRTIEYWDTERKRYPQYEHCAVIVAEDITSRFLNVISLFNGYIPIIAIQVKALKVGDNISLFFTKVLDELTLGTDAEDESEPADAKYWDAKASKESLTLADAVITLVSEFAPGYRLKLNKHYLGVAKDGIAQNFIVIHPRKNATLLLNVRLEASDEIQNKLNDSGLEMLSYDRQWKQYRIRLTREDLEANRAVIKELIQMAFDKYMN